MTRWRRRSRRGCRAGLAVFRDRPALVDGRSVSERETASPYAVRLARNAASGVGRFAVAALLALAVTPFALRTLGDARFGLWALAGVLVTLARLLDLGLNRSLTRTVAMGEGRDDPATVGVALATGRALMLLLGVALIGLVWCARHVLVGDVLRLPRDLWSVGRYVLVGTAVVAAVEGVFAPFQAALDGIGRMDVSNGISTASRVISAIGVVIVLSLGMGLPGLVWKNLAIALVTGLGYQVALRRRAPALAHVDLAFDRGQARQLLAFGRHIQTVSLGPLAVDLVGKLLLSRGVGLGGVTVYELALRIANTLGGALMSMSMAIFPAAARDSGDEEADRKLVALHQRAARYVAWVVLPSYALLIALARPFVAAWLGADYEDVARAIVYLGAGGVIATASTPAYMVAQAGGRERHSTVASLVTVGVALGAAAALVGEHGVMGVAGGVGAGLAAGGVAIWILFARGFGSGWSTVGFFGMRAPLAAVLAGLAAHLFADHVPVTLVGVATAACVGLTVYVGVLVLCGEMGRSEWSAAFALLGRKKEA